MGAPARLDGRDAVAEGTIACQSGMANQRRDPHGRAMRLRRGESTIRAADAALADAMNPALNGRRHIAPDETERFARYGERFAAIQSRKSAKHGSARALHRKQLTVARGIA